MVIDVNKYNAEYPECYNWSLLNSPKLEKVARIIQGQIKIDLTTKDRIFTGGLRSALQVIKKIDDETT